MIDVPQRVKDSLRKGSYRKNWRILVLSDDNAVDFVINNENLVKDSIRLDERMCSGDELKFGLCEGSSFEFQYFGFPNIKGRRIQVFLDIEYKTAEGSLEWYEMPMGFFDVDQCPRQFDTGIMKVTAFNKLRSKYLDAEAKADVTELIEAGESGVKDSISIYTLLREMLKGYSIRKKSYIKGETKFSGVSGYNVYSIETYTSSGQASGSYVNIFFISYSMRLDKNDFYKFKIYGDVIKKNSKKAWTVQRFRQTKINDVMYTIDELPDTDFEAAYRLSGSWQINNNDDGGKCTAEITTEDRTNVNRLSISIPVYCEYTTTRSPSITSSVMAKMDQAFETNWNDVVMADIFQLYLSEIEKQKLTIAEIESVQNVTLRDLQSAVYEMNCTFGQLDRETDLFSGVELNNQRLYPSDLLYPKDDLFPMSQAERANASMYQKLWTDEGSQKKFKDLIITYKTIGDDGNAVEKTLQRQVNADGNVNYNMSSNWLFKNLLWSSESVGAYADAMVEKMRAVSWIPFEMWSAGLPYLETGDEIEIKTKEGTARSYILTRQLTGIHDLMDTYTNGELDIF